MNRPILATLAIIILAFILIGIYGYLGHDPPLGPGPTPQEETTEAQETTQEKNEPVSPGPIDPPPTPSPAPSPDQYEELCELPNTGGPK